VIAFIFDVCFTPNIRRSFGSSARQLRARTGPDARRHGDPQSYAADPQPDPHELMRPFPAEPMRMWPISTRVNKPENDDPSIVEPIELCAA
jgi:hypothetical protein